MPQIFQNGKIYFAIFKLQEVKIFNILYMFYTGSKSLKKMCVPEAYGIYVSK